MLFGKVYLKNDKIHLKIKQVIDYHDQIIEKFGGLHGIKNIGLLESPWQYQELQHSAKSFIQQFVIRQQHIYPHIVKKTTHSMMEIKDWSFFSACVFLSVNGISVDFRQKV